MSTQESQIKNFIIAKAKERTEIAGSFIGDSILKDLGINMRSEYGGLKKFIRQHCYDELQWLRKKGGDDIFSHVSNLQRTREIDSEKDRPNYRELRSESFWKVFNNPKIKKILLLDTTNGQLNIRNDSESVPENFIVIENVTRDEHRQIAWDFLAELDDPKKNEFRQVLSFEDFWPHWSALLRKYRNVGILRNWLKWVDAKICDLFESRLRLAQLPDNIINDAIGNLKLSLEQLTKPRQSYQSVDRKLGSINEPLRSIIHAVIDRMSEEEIRRIWLPIGLLSDVLKQNNHKG